MCKDPPPHLFPVVGRNSWYKVANNNLKDKEDVGSEEVSDRQRFENGRNEESQNAAYLHVFNAVGFVVDVFLVSLHLDKWKQGCWGNQIVGINCNKRKVLLLWMQ